ncbi:unnamed protein product [Haemonchus placei]|uniref:Uncharacterized protein n=1 Tax=Haemonchus placei TaxID=6290 RepID=A0A0N4W7Q8_HAEPC|nr:unnamed protein product [Haemonchus placei]
MPILTSYATQPELTTLNLSGTSTAASASTPSPTNSPVERRDVNGYVTQEEERIGGRFTTTLR